MTGTGIVAAVVAGSALAYAVEEGRRLLSGRRFRLVGRSQSLRRIVGSILVAGLMALVYSGLDLVDPHRALPIFLLVWATASLLVLILLPLAWLDLRELDAHRDIERARETLRFGKELGREKGPAEPEPPRKK